MDNQVIVSVVVPALDEGTILASCLESLKRQTYEEYEVIVVDNGSTDDTVEVAKSFRCKVIREPRKGVAIARQTGFESASGDIVASTDADTTVPNEWLKKIVGKFEKDPGVVGVYGDVSFVARGGGSKHVVDLLFGYFLRISNWMGRPNLCGPNFAVRRDAFWKAGGFMDKAVYYDVAEDVQLGMKLRNLGKVALCKNLTVRTSSRKLEKSGIKYVLKHARNYVEVAWLGRRK